MFGKIIRFTLGMALGAGVGVATAMLLAPASGDETRQSVQDRLAELGDSYRQAQLEKEQEMRQQFEEKINLEEMREREEKHDAARLAKAGSNGNRG